MRLRDKVLLTILLATSYWMLRQHFVFHDKSDGCFTEISLAQLQKWYVDGNKDYFDDQLPHDTVIVWESLRYKKAMGDTVCNEQGCRIRLDPYVNIASVTAQETEYHEMCHVATTGEELDFHGPKFQNCITMLFKKGALDGLI